MTQTITIDPITRVEGHGKITLQLNDQGQLADALFCVKEFRGFEKFCEGALAEKLPLMTSRICGICPVSHHLAATRAVEDCFGVQIPMPAQRQRELLLLGQTIESHVLALAMLSLPDFLLADAPPSKRNILGLYESNPEAATRALELRAAGLAIVQTVGRRFGHPVGARIGGMALPLAETERQELLAKLNTAEPHLGWFTQLWHDLADKHVREIDALGDIQTGFMGLAQDDGMAFYGDTLKVMGADGSTQASFSAHTYFDHVAERIENWSYMKFPVLKSGEPFRVGPLARANLAEHISTPRASAELAWFRQRWPRPAQKTLCYHFARWIEVVYAFERAQALLSDPAITGTDVFAKPEIKAGAGIGVVEAPRGTLVHRYELDDAGKTVKVNLIVATQHNNLALNAALKASAASLVTGKQPEDKALNELEMIVRAHDPCLSCATHTLGSRTFTIELLDSNGQRIREWC